MNVNYKLMNMKKSRKFNFNRNLIIFFCLILIFSPFSSLSSIFVQEAQAEGLNEAIEITNAKQVNDIRHHLDGNYILGADIDLSEVKDWQAIGTSENPFAGTFNGNGFKIIEMDSQFEGEEQQGLFGALTSGAVVKNLEVAFKELPELSEEAEDDIRNNEQDKTNLESDKTEDSVEEENDKQSETEEEIADEADNEEDAVQALQMQLLNDNNFAGGDGSAANPYLIETAEQLDEVRNHLTKHFKLIADIDLGVTPYNEGEGWEPIGIDGNQFRGSFDGSGKTITNLKINRPDEKDIGLFGFVYGVTIKNVELINVDVRGKNKVGALVGSGLTGPGLTNQNHIVNAQSSGTVNGEDDVGGLIGNLRVNVENSKSSVNVNGIKQVGGLIGNSPSVDNEINDSSASGTVIGTEMVGGLVGRSMTTITNGSASGNVIGTGNKVGGLVGEFSGSQAIKTFITNSDAAGNVEGDGYVGGLVGYARENLEIAQSSSSGNIRAAGDGGGLVGNLYIGDIVESFATGQVEGKVVGGLVGRLWHTGKISDVYATGSVNGTQEAGGLIGRDQGGSIKNSYATGKVSTPTHWSGGLIGVAGNDITINDSLYDKETSGKSDDTGKGTPKTTAEMKMHATFTNWDFDNVWDLPAGDYPRLQWEGIDGQLPVHNGDIIYVKEGGSGNEDGTGWDHAFATLQEGLDVATAGKQIWIAKGSYYPTKDISGEDNPTNSRMKTFQMKNGVEIYGGFEGNEAQDTNLSSRDFSANETVLSGDLGIQGDKRDNAYHVFHHPNGLNLDETAVLDGVTLRDGNANHSSSNPAHASLGGGMLNDSNSPTINNVKIRDNYGVYGGGIYNSNSDPKLSNVDISNNLAAHGGGIYNIESSPLLTNSTISENEAAGDSGGGGGIINLNASNPTLKSVLIIKNKASGQYGSGGGIHNIESNQTLTDVTLAENNATEEGGGIYNLEGDTHLENVSIQENKSKYGAGIYNEGKLVIDGGDITKNTALRGGGGILSTEVNSTLTMENVSVTANKAYEGGGITLKDGTEASIINGIINENEATNSFGGGIYVFNQTTDLNILDTEIRNNRATAVGGGIYNALGNLLMEDVIVDGNKSKTSGAGLYSSSGKQHIIGGKFSNNTSMHSGGAIVNNKGELELSNSLLYNNLADDSGGAIYTISDSTSKVINTTIADNNSQSDGASIVNSATGKMEIYNSIVWANESINIENINADADSLLVAHSIVGDSGASGGNWDRAMGKDEGNNLDVDPSFVDSQNGNYQLQEDSPAIDAGNNSLLPATIISDLAGNNRIFGAALDMGAYEFQAHAAKEITSVEDMADIRVAHGTNLASASLPSQVEVTLDDNSTRILDVTWNGGTPVYDGNTEGVYEFQGTLSLKPGIQNKAGLRAIVKVIVESAKTSNKDITGYTVGSVTLELGTTDREDLPLPEKVTVTLDDNSEIDLDVNWENDSTPIYKKNEEGLYVFEGEFVLVNGVTNTQKIQAKFQVNLEGDQLPDPADDKEIANVPIFGAAFEVGQKRLDEILQLLPATVEVTLVDGTEKALELEWSDISNPVYEMNEVGQYIFTGELVLTDGLTNPNNFTIEYWVNLMDSEDPKDLADPENPADPEDPEDPKGQEDLEVSKEVIEPSNPEEPKDSKEDSIEGEDEKLQVTVEKEDETDEKGKNALPKTATNYYTFVLIGMLLITLASGAYFVFKRRRSS